MTVFEILYYGPVVFIYKKKTPLNLIEISGTLLVCFSSDSLQIYINCVSAISERILEMFIE